MHALNLLDPEAERELFENESDPESRLQYDPGRPPPTHDEDIKRAKERTVFVNAAAWPMGKMAWREVKVSYLCSLAAPGCPSLVYS